MKQVLIKNGSAIVEDVPAPHAEAGAVLVEVDYSCISLGTEMSGIRSSGTPLWKRALNDTWKVKKAMEMVASKGFCHTASIVKGQLDAESPTGYSATGSVIVDFGQV